MNDSTRPVENEVNQVEKPANNRAETSSPRHLVRKIILALFAVILMAATTWVGVSRHRNQRNLDRIRGEYRELKSKDDAVNNIKSRRVEFFRIQSFLNSPSRVAFATAAFIRKLGSVDSSRLVFSELNLFPGNQNIIFHIKAIVQSLDEREHASIADAFCQQLKSWSEIFDVYCLSDNSGNSRSSLPVLVVSGKVEVE